MFMAYGSFGPLQEKVFGFLPVVAKLVSQGHIDGAQDDFGALLDDV